MRTREKIEAYVKETGNYQVAILEVLLDIRDMVREYFKEKWEMEKSIKTWRTKRRKTL